MTATDKRQLQGELLQDEPLARHTSWRVGGRARVFYRPADRDDLVRFLRTLPSEEPLLWLGLGSNLLVRDGGFDGTVLATKGSLERIEVTAHGLLYAEAGAACARVARVASRNGMAGMAFLAGIPGTVGGALAMNAGAFGGETWQRVREVETLDRQGVVRKRTPEDFNIGYRQAVGPQGEWFLSALLQPKSGDAQAGQAEIRRLLEKRAASQPIGLPSCGSVFRNPPNDHAARLIEAAGLKGECVGGACVSQKHANFIINTGDATAADIESLIERVRQRVQQHSGVLLQPEVHIVGQRGQDG